MPCSAWKWVNSVLWNFPDCDPCSRGVFVGVRKLGGHFLSYIANLVRVLMLRTRNTGLCRPRILELPGHPWRCFAVSRATFQQKCQDRGSMWSWWSSPNVPSPMYYLTVKEQRIFWGDRENLYGFVLAYHWLCSPCEVRSEWIWISHVLGKYPTCSTVTPAQNREVLRRWRKDGL